MVIASSAERAWQELRAVLRNHAMLAVLDAQRASAAVIRLMIVAVAIVLLGVSAWLALLGAMIFWLAGALQLDWPGVLLIAAVVNLVVVALLFGLTRRLFVDRPFAATLRQLRADATLWS